MKNTITLVCLFFLPFTFASYGQGDNFTKGGNRSAKMSVVRVGEIGKQVMDPLFRSSMVHLSKEESDLVEDIRVKQMKEEKTLHKSYHNGRSGLFDSQSSTTPTPALGVSYASNYSEANWPCDNSIAVSNGGIVVSLINSNIAYFDLNGTNTYFSGLWDFYNDNTYVDNICDPKIIYDRTADRFIFYTQTCDAVSANSYVIMSFSKTNNPADGWWVYHFSGNPLGDNSWWDYPKLAISHDDVFITGNLFIEGGGYNQSLVYQIDKSQAYSGQPVDYFYWSGLTGNPFTLLPVTNMLAGNTDVDMYLVSTETGTSSTIHVYYIDNNVASGTPSISHATVATAQYAIGGYAAQPGGGNIDVGDNRAQSGFRLNGILHLVFSSDIGGGFNGINYNRIAVPSLTRTTYFFGDQGNNDITYPSVIPFSNSSTDKSVLLCFQYSGTLLPGFGVAYCDDGGTFSAGVNVKSGDGVVSNCFNADNTAQRCGDYSGIARNWNSTNPSAWVMGSYGYSTNYWHSWSAEIHLTGVGVGEIDKGKNDLSLFPNPVKENFRTEFTMPATDRVLISIRDMQGNIVKDLFNGYAARGENSFSFSKGNLANGVYMISIADSQNKIIKDEKFVVAD
jgi:hypothetical protein